MEITDTLQFSHRDRKEIYDYVERHGAVRSDEVRRALGMDPTAFGTHVTILRREGYLEETDGRLQVAFQSTDAERHRDGDLEFTIRSAHQDDLTELVDAIRSVAREGRYIEAETVAELLNHEEAVLRHNEIRSRMFFVAMVEDEVVGWVHLDLPEAEKLAHTAVLTVGVRPERHGRGIGSALLERGCAWARDHDFEKLYNSVPATNERAIEFLESHGWQTEAVREDHYRIDGAYVDEVMMAVFLR
jgi:ribosomal protein S18 acetylase RimI-like enzyme